MPSEEASVIRERMEIAFRDGWAASIQFWLTAVCDRHRKGLDCDQELNALFNAMVQYRACFQ